jgi:hypothetical protein
MFRKRGYGLIIGQALAKAGVNIIGQITSVDKIHTFCREEDLKNGVLALAETFDLLAE